MDNFDDEIVDLEEENQQQVNSQPETTTPQKQIQVMNFMQNRHKDQKTNEKLRNIGSRNRSFPSLEASNFNKNTNKKKPNTSNNEGLAKKSSLPFKSPLDGLFGGGLLGSKTTTHGKIKTPLVLRLLRKKIKIFIIIGAAIVAAITIILVVIFGAASEDDPKSIKGMADYIIASEETIEQAKDELYEKLIYYGYCRSKEDCESKGIIKIIDRLRNIYTEYKKECTIGMDNMRLSPGNDLIYKPCGLEINPNLILATLNYYSVNSRVYYDYHQEEEPPSNIFEFFYRLFLNYQREQAALQDIDMLANAQAEYVEEKCRYLDADEQARDLADGSQDNREDQHIMYYYQIEYDKYISFLKYGYTSSHPNYKEKKPLEVKNDICVGQQNDTIPS